MSQDPRLFTPMFSIDVCTDSHTAAVSNKIDANELIVNLLKQLVDGQQQELKLLQEITQWKDTNPDLARSCRIASEALVKVQNDYIHKLTEEAADGYETMMDSEFMLQEFIDRFGPRMAHLGGVLHMVSSLSAQKDAPPTAPAQEP